MSKQTENFEFEEQIDNADTDTLRRIVRAVAIARTQWWGAGDNRDADEAYIGAVGVAFHSEFE